MLRSYLLQRTREQVQARDLDCLNQAAERLNAEAAEVIEYQGMGADSPAHRSAEE